MSKDGGAGRSPTITNRKAFHEFEVLEARVRDLLAGPEVKSLREGRANLAEAYARLRGGELWLLKMHVEEYRDRGQVKLEPARPRKLLVHRRQIEHLAEAVEREGHTLVPLRIYWNERGIAKVEIGVARGKKLHDKRDAEKAKAAKREMARALRR